MKIIIETIPHMKQPYSTCGDWRRDADGTLRINVSQEIGDRYAALVALHELVEVLLCEARGISTKSVDEFDIEYEKLRAKSLTLDTSEPGDNRFAPYENEHCIATGIERIVAAALHVKWQDYETAINSRP
jgi:hypothetical protein